MWSGCSADCAEKPRGGARDRDFGGQTRSVPRYTTPSCDFAPARVVGMWSCSGRGVRRATGGGGLRRSCRGLRAGTFQASPDELPTIDIHPGYYFNGRPRRAVRAVRRRHDRQRPQGVRVRVAKLKATGPQSGGWSRDRRRRPSPRIVNAGCSGEPSAPLSARLRSQPCAPSPSRLAKPSVSPWP